MKLKLLPHKIIFTFISLFGSVALFAQPPGGPPPGGGGGDPPCWAPECIPIDGGIIFLIVGGIMLGVFTVYSHKSRA